MLSFNIIHIHLISRYMHIMSTCVWKSTNMSDSNVNLISFEWKTYCCDATDTDIYIFTRVSYEFSTSLTLSIFRTWWFRTKLHVYIDEWCVSFNIISIGKIQFNLLLIGYCIPRHNMSDIIYIQLSAESAYNSITLAHNTAIGFVVFACVCFLSRSVQENCPIWISIQQ